jgi:molybdopterin/thiamine biosynthesis adenylyltransferase
MSQHHTRFKDCEWYSKEYTPVSVGGVGGIGSWLTFFLARIGVQCQVYDFDMIDYTNLGGQMYGQHQIGVAKTRAVQNTVRDFCGDADSELVVMMGKYKGTDVQPITFSCFDNMEVREVMFNKWVEMWGRNRRLGQACAFIDGRMTVESFQVYIVQPNEESIQAYRETLFASSQITDPLCSMKATSHIGAMIGSYMAQAFTNIISNHNIGFEAREVPFKSAYEAAFMDFLSDEYV